MTNFNQIYNRRNTGSLKWDRIITTYQEDDLLPLWVADMDFKAPQKVLDELQSVISQGILGYTIESDTLYEAIQHWQNSRYGATLSRNEILFSSGVVPSIVLCIQAFTQPGDSVMIHDPVYYPFSNSIINNQRTLIRSSLIEKDGRYIMDFEDMEKQIKENQVKLFIFCNPHNPGGRVWTREELQQFGELCKKYNVLIISDEIHQDLVYQPNTFIPFLTVDKRFEDFSLALTAATKTFNLAGIKNSMIFIKNEKLRNILSDKINQNAQHEINTFGLVGTEAAYRYGSEWLEDLLAYLQENIKLVIDFFTKELSQVKIMKPEGTYLVWLDFKAFQLTDKELQDRIVHKGKVVLNSGVSFGPTGSGFLRLNVACPKETLETGLQRIKVAFEDLL